MKLLSITLLVVALGFSDLNSTVELPAGGINFIDGSLQDALAAAKIEKKPVFAYVYAKWCGQCKRLKKSFKDDAAAAYFNTNFINIAVDGESDEGKMVREHFNVKVYPTLMILNSNGRLQTSATGYKEPYHLMNFGKRIVPN